MKACYFCRGRVSDEQAHEVHTAGGCGRAWRCDACAETQNLAALRAVLEES